MQIQPRLIKKYPNRRLYDTEASVYITLTDLKNLVEQYIPFKIVHAKTEQDITCNVLMQLLLELESDNQYYPAFSQPVLEQMIRVYKTPMGEQFTQMLNQAFGAFMQQQPSHSFSANIDNNLQQWQELWQRFWSPGTTKPAD